MAEIAFCPGGARATGDWEYLAAGSDTIAQNNGSVTI